MAAELFYNGYININSNVLSTKGNEITLNYEADTLEDTAFGDTTHSNQGGLKNWSASVKFFNEHVDNGLDEIMFPLVGTIVPIEFRKDAGSVGVNNAKYTAYGLIKSYSPLSGKVGTLMEASVEIVPGKGAGSPTLVRATA